MAAPRPASPRSAPEQHAVTVRSLGADGDGVARAADGKTLFLPLTLPGERVAPGPLTRRGPAWAAPSTILDPSPDRATPPCRHFGPCGGCAVQHMTDAAYAAWKLGLVQDTLRKLGYSTPLSPLLRTPPAARRRMDLAIQRAPGGAILIGLHARRSPDIVNMTECPVLHPALFRVIEALRPVLRSLDGLKRHGAALVNLLDAGPDLLLRTDAPLSSNDRTRLTALASTLGLPRIAWSQGTAQSDRSPPEPACQLRPATTALAGQATPIPPGAFLQASLEGEHAIQQAVLATLPRPKAKARIIELFAGCGTLTHAIATIARVEAFEGDPAAVAALRAAANPRVAVTTRDLARQPLQAKDLKSAAAIVLDPPWAGALAQMPALAASGLPIVYVSCNPQALLRDGRLLLAAGYRVTAAIAIDQFLWSPRVESVVAFARP